MKRIVPSVEETIQEMSSSPITDVTNHANHKHIAIAQAPPRILLLAGSAQQPSRVLASLSILAERLQQLGASPYLWDLYEQPLPLMSSQYSLQPSANGTQAVQRLAQLAEEADAFVLGSPVYHNSFSGVLKNALDSLSPRQFQNKPVALVSSGNSDRTGSQPCEHLRSVVRGLLAIPIPTQLVTVPSDFTRSQEIYTLASEPISERCSRLAKELVAYAMLMRELPTFYTEMLAQAMSI